MRLIFGFASLIVLCAQHPALAGEPRDGDGQAMPAPAAKPTPPSPQAEALFEQAWALERDGKGREAVKLYVRAARAGSAKAAKRLGEIYDRGIEQQGPRFYPGPDRGVPPSK